MNADEFQTALATALRLCRAMASARLPIEEMLAYVEYAREERLELSERGRSAGDPGGMEDLEALRTIIEAVGDVSAIGARLPAEPTPIRVPACADGVVPMPTNLTA